VRRPLPDEPLPAVDHSPAQLRSLAAAGVVLLVAGCVVGWFTRTPTSLVAGPDVVVRPDGVLSLDAVAWLLLAPLLVAPLVPRGRRLLAGVAAATVPGLALVALASALPPRRAVDGETIGELVADRTLGQALSVVGACIVVMALVAAWRRAPDWRIPQGWSRPAEDA
jgi:hypothetical protein